MSGLGTQILEHRPASSHESICEPSTAISVEQPECSIGVTIGFSLGGCKDKRLQVRSVACLQGGWLRIGVGRIYPRYPAWSFSHKRSYKYLKHAHKYSKMYVTWAHEAPRY